MKPKQTRRIYLAFEFVKDAQRRTQFISQADLYCRFNIEDLSLPSAVHDSRWQKEAKKRIKKAQVVIVLLGQNTNNATGVKDEVSLAGEVGCPVVQLMPQKLKYGRISRKVPVCMFIWTYINEMLNDPSEYVKKS